MVENSLELCSQRVLRIRIRERKQMHVKQLENVTGWLEFQG